MEVYDISKIIYEAEEIAIRIKTKVTILLVRLKTKPMMSLLLYSLISLNFYTIFEDDYYYDNY